MDIGTDLACVLVCHVVCAYVCASTRMKLHYRPHLFNFYSFLQPHLADGFGQWGKECETIPYPLHHVLCLFMRLIHSLFKRIIISALEENKY